MRTYVLFLLCFMSETGLSAGEKITAVYDEAVKYCHENSGRLPSIGELRIAWKHGKLRGGHSYWSSTCLAERPHRGGWDSRWGDCVTYWKPNFKYEMIQILDGQGKVKIEEPNSPEVKVVRCVPSK